MKRFKSARQAQRCLSAHDGINNLFHLRRDYRPAAHCRAARAQAFHIWAEVTGAARKGMTKDGLRLSRENGRGTALSMGGATHALC